MPKDITIYRMTVHSLVRGAFSHGTVGYFTSREALAEERRKWSKKWRFVVDEIILDAALAQEVLAHDPRSTASSKGWARNEQHRMDK